MYRVGIDVLNYSCFTYVVDAVSSDDIDEDEEEETNMISGTGNHKSSIEELIEEELPSHPGILAGK